jgi:hypothetical protein
MPSFLEVLTQSEEGDELRLLLLCTQIENIVRSYDDRLDAFAELIQNAADAVIQRWEQAGEYAPVIQVHVDCATQRLTVLDNGVGVSEDNFYRVFQPNFSLKRQLRHQHARGEKGAGVVFLQFGHGAYGFSTKVAGFQRTFNVANGERWFEDTLTILQRDDLTWDEKQELLPADPHTETEAISTALDELEQGTESHVEFTGRPSHPHIDQIFADPSTALKRLEALCRTRTALGYFRPPTDTDLHPCLLALRFDARITYPDGTVSDPATFDTGFQFPHAVAARRGRHTSTMVNPSQQSELLYEFFDAGFLSQALPDLLSDNSHSALVHKFSLRGYFSYAYNNTFYEDLARTDLGLPQDDPELEYELVQTNAGFQIAVRDFPNGRRHSFLHRSGAEDKSRTYILLDFSGPYKPDYGRKNVADEVRPLVIQLCKDLIAWSTKSDRKSKLRRGRGQAPHQATEREAAQRVLERDTTDQHGIGPWLDARESPAHWNRPCRSEAEVLAQFTQFVADGRLPGFRLYELSARMLDMMFDFRMDPGAGYVFDGGQRPLGLRFPDNEPRKYDGDWAEFKITSDMLCDDIAKAPGTQGKKYFTMINLLVCETVDDAVDGYIVDEIDADNVVERRYFGVTHLLRSEANQEHVIQVIELAALRPAIGVSITDNGPGSA